MPQVKLNMTFQSFKPGLCLACLPTVNDKRSMHYTDVKFVLITYHKNMIILKNTSANFNCYNSNSIKTTQYTSDL